ncbi:acyl-CoA dehydrogenase family protein [Candidatus Amarolinea dominans]|uniref:acyl-CoA dehydrogenase family protein n=1 Tax=Candidatus Amarolinea dominans TaxID=3140696 RepID=UPI003135CDC5|nr:hypothetical protein [Anaerolineae bacterium]
MEEAITCRGSASFGHLPSPAQGISFMVADMAMNIHAGRLLTWQAAWRPIGTSLTLRRSAFAKAFAPTW